MRRSRRWLWLGAGLMGTLLLVVMALRHVGSPFEVELPAAPTRGAAVSTTMSVPAGATAPEATAELRRLLNASPGRDPEADAAFAQMRAELPYDPDWQDPLPEVVDRLRPMAEAGDMRAARVLGQRLLLCVPALRDDTPEQLLQSYRGELADYEAEAQRNPKGAASRQYNIDNQFKRRMEHYEQCAAIEPKTIKAAMRWLERAGRAGEPGARLAYAQHAFTEFKETGALIARVEEAARRREVAQAWLDQLVAEGNDQALALYVEALHGNNPLYAADPFRAQAYGYALQLVYSRRASAVRRGPSAGRRGDDFARLWAEGPQRYGDALTPAQWDAAAEDGRRIFREHFERMPILP